MAKIDNFESSIASTIRSLSPAERLSLKMTEIAAFRPGQVALREYLPVLVQAAKLWGKELNRINTQLGGHENVFNAMLAIKRITSSPQIHQEETMPRQVGHSSNTML